MARETLPARGMHGGGEQNPYPLSMYEVSPAPDWDSEEEIESRHTPRDSVLQLPQTCGAIALPQEQDDEGYCKPPETYDGGFQGQDWGQ